jgi:Tfp pilus assembly protein PilF
MAVKRIWLTVLMPALAIVVCALPAGAAEAGRVHGGDRGGVLAKVQRALVRWDVSGAREILDSLPPDRPPLALWYEGQVEFLSGRYGEALEHFELLEQLGGAGPGLREMTRLVRDTVELSQKLTPHESEHFVLFVDEGRDRILAEPALQTLEAAYDSLGSWLGLHPGERIRVEIIPDAKAFERVSSLSRTEIETSGAVGICKFNKIMLLSPRALLQGYRWRDSLAHEYIHYLLVHLTANRAPVWLQEGVSRYGETLWRSPESLWLGKTQESIFARALREGALVPFGNMDPSLVRLPTMGKVQLAFAECALAVEYLLQEWKIEGLRGLLKKMASGEERKETGPAMRESLGIDLAGFEKLWRVYLDGRGFVEIQGLTIPDMKIRSGGNGGGAEEWDLERWQPLEARKHIKLGDMLRARHRYGAALWEYRRALKISPASPFVLNRIGMAQRELSANEKAEARFREAAAIYPGYPTSYANLAEVLALEGRWKESRRALEEYLAINPFNPFVWKDLGSVLMELGETQAAVRSWETSLELNPADPELRRALGRP